MEQKSLPPSPHKLRKAAREGRVLRSRILTLFFAFLGFVSVGLLASMGVWVRFGKVVNYCFASESTSLHICIAAGGSACLFCVVAVLSVSSFAAGFAEWVQAGCAIEGALVLPKVSRLNPADGFRRLYNRGRENVTPLAAFLGGVLIVFVSYREAIAFSIAAASNGLVIQDLFKLVGRFAGTALTWTLVMGVADFLLERRRFYRDLSMSVDEFRRETRETDGDAAIKAYRRSVHEALAMEDLKRRVRRARVIIVEKLEG